MEEQRSFVATLAYFLTACGALAAALATAIQTRLSRQKRQDAGSFDREAKDSRIEETLPKPPLPSDTGGIPVLPPVAELVGPLDPFALTLVLKGMLQWAAQPMGGTSAVLLYWEPASTPTHGSISVLAEWSGTDIASGSRYNRTATEEDYYHDVIAPMQRASWVTLKTEALTPDGLLSDMYSSQGTQESQLYRVLRDSDGTLLFTSVRFRSPSPWEPARCRNTLRELSAGICRELHHDNLEA